MSANNTARSHHRHPPERRQSHHWTPGPSGKHPRDFIPPVQPCHAHYPSNFKKDHLVSNLENEIDQYLRGVERHRTLEKLAESAPPHIGSGRGSSRGALSSYLCTGLRSLGQHSVCTVLIHRKTCVIFDSRHLEAKQQQNKATPGPGQFTLPMAPDSRFLVPPSAVFYGCITYMHDQLSFSSSW